MNRLFVGIYDFFLPRRRLLWGLLAVLSALMAVLAIRVNYDERITSFFPNNDLGRRSSVVFDNLKAKDKIVVMFSSQDEIPDKLVEYGDAFAQELYGRIDSSYISSSILTADDARAGDVVSYIYADLPAYLADEDYARIDSLLSPDGIAAAMERNRNLMLSPAGSVMKNYITQDPLGVGGGVMAGLKELSEMAQYEMYDSHIFAPGLRTMIMVIEPAYGIGDTGANDSLVDAIEESIDVLSGGDVEISYCGGPCVAVYNARRIKSDTALTMTIALIVIIVFIRLVFRSRWAVLLLVVPVLFGALFALSVIGLSADGSISAIAIGAGAAVFGIALSYSIHVISHSNHTHDPREVVAELAYPLTVGSFTTIGAFLGLLFTQSQLLRDFGLFSALTLTGTTIFCLVFMPHMLGRPGERKSSKLLRAIEKMADYGFDRNKWLLGGVAVLTVVCLFFYNDVKFDSDMMNLNYTPSHLKNAEDNLKNLIGSGSPSVILVSAGETPEEAYEAYRRTESKLDSLQEEGLIDGFSSASRFAVPADVRRLRAERWNYYWRSKDAEQIARWMRESAARNGFSRQAADAFAASLTPEHIPSEFSEGDTPIFLRDWMTVTDEMTMFISHISIPDANKEEVYARFGNDDAIVVDRGYFAGRMAQTVSDDFYLVLFISSILIFAALLISYGRIELALMAFLPMCISWVIILGIMALFGIEFNIVNIILSTFIFGIGDDFSIFIMDGLLSEYKTGKKLLPAHKTAIFFSAFTTVAGIGVLVFARHPALHSLSLISILGMVAVVVVAYAVQPVVFRVFITSQTSKGGFPYTLMSLLNTLYAFIYFVVGCVLMQAYIVVLLLLPVRVSRKKKWFHNTVCTSLRIFLRTMFTTKLMRVNECKETFEKPSIIIANHQSFIDILVLLSLYPKLIMVTNSWVWNSPFFGWLVRYADFYHTADGYEKLADTVRPRIEEGYSVVIFPEGTRSADGTIGRFRKGAFYLSRLTGLDILPIVLYGNGMVSSKQQPFYIKKGMLVSRVMPRIPAADTRFGNTDREKARNIAVWFREQYEQTCERFDRPTNKYFRDALIKNYIYKDPVLEWYMRIKVRMEKNYRLFDSMIPRRARIVDVGCGYGALAYMLSLLSPHRKVLGIDYDCEKIELALRNFSRTEMIDFVADNALDAKLPEADVFILNDVLHYLDYESQDELLERCLARVSAGGMVIVRDGDSAKAAGHKVTGVTEKWSTRILGFNKTSGRLCFTSGERIRSLAERCGFSVAERANDRITSNTIYVLTRKTTDDAADSI